MGLRARLVACLAELSQIPGRMLEIADEADAASEERLRSASATASASRKSKRRGDASCTRWTWKAAASGGIAFSPRPSGTSTRTARWRAAFGASPASGGADCAMLARLFVTAADPCVSAEVRVH